MLSFVIALGKVGLWLAVVLVPIGAAIFGYNYPNQPAPMPYGFAPFEPIRAILAAAGFVGGLLGVGFSFGPIAAVFDIQRRIALQTPLTPLRHDPADWRR